MPTKIKVPTGRISIARLGRANSFTICQKPRLPNRLALSSKLVTLDRFIAQLAIKLDSVFTEKITKFNPHITIPNRKAELLRKIIKRIRIGKKPIFGFKSRMKNMPIPQAIFVEVFKRLSLIPDLSKDPVWTRNFCKIAKTPIIRPVVWPFTKISRVLEKVNIA